MSQNLKRSVEDKNCGPLIKTIMTRCIHCTRCVRFIDEIGGLNVLGTTNRGNKTEIGTYIHKNITSELSGNLIDLCPVGALTSKPYAYKSRSWELKSKHTIDITDGLGSNTITNLRGAQILRVLPGINYRINKEWISDKARYSFDGLDSQRIFNSFFKNKKIFNHLNWKLTFALLKKNIKNFIQTDSVKVSGIFGKTQSLENIFAFKQTIHQIGGQNSQIIHENFNNYYNSNFINNYQFKSDLTNFDEYDACFLLGTNLRHESPVLNAHIRKRFLKGNFNVYNLSSSFEPTYPTIHLGFSLKDIEDSYQGRHTFIKKILQAKNPIFIIGTQILNLKESELIQNFLYFLRKKLQKKFGNKWDNLNFLHPFGNSLISFELGLTHPLKLNSEKNLIFLLGTDEFLPRLKSKNNFIVYIGSHGTSSAKQAGFILPTNGFHEEFNSIINTERRLQFSEQVKKSKINSPTWALLFLIGNYLNPGFQQKYLQITSKKLLLKSILTQYGLNENHKIISLFCHNKEKKFININKNNIYYNFTNIIENYYLTDPITRNSKIMGQSSTKLRMEQNFIKN